MGEHINHRLTRQVSLILRGVGLFDEGQQRLDFLMTGTEFEQPLDLLAFAHAGREVIIYRAEVIETKHRQFFIAESRHE